MSGNIFNIQEDYLKLMAEIETNDGVLDKEQEYKLKVNEEELEAKLKAYANIIKLKQGDIQLCKDEIDRLTTIKKSRESLIERLKDVIKQAVNLFGIEGKTGNRRLDFDTIKFYTTVRDSLVIPEDYYSTDYMIDTVSIKIPAKYETELLKHLDTIQNEDLNNSIVLDVKAVPNKDLIKSTLEEYDELYKLNDSVDARIEAEEDVSDEEMKKIERFKILNKELEGCSIIKKDSVTIK